uniref:Uncharacterized protein n=1 Tax=Streptococcus thermophilus TaxID=1308 RepID=Q70LH0_STRTR|nr:hypothetical protein [Streptococcus thermophilus]
MGSIIYPYTNLKTTPPPLWGLGEPRQGIFLYRMPIFQVFYRVCHLDEPKESVMSQNLEGSGNTKQFFKKKAKS